MSVAESSASLDELEEFFDSAYFSWAMPGSDPRNEDLHHRPFSPQCAGPQPFLLALQTNPGIHDIAEMFGGQGECIKLAARRKLSTGLNFDLTCEFNLLDPEHVKFFWQYLTKHKPRVLICGPP
jgi:hypothetical protein